MMLQIDIHRWFAMVAILNPKWPPKYKNPLIWAKFGLVQLIPIFLAFHVPLDVDVVPI
jgi:hypothetical protein